MSFSSKPKKVKPQGTIRELKIVHTVNSCGVDTLKTEEVETPRHKNSQKLAKVLFPFGLDLFPIGDHLVC